MIKNKLSNNIITFAPIVSNESSQIKMRVGPSFSQSVTQKKYPLCMQRMLRDAQTYGTGKTINHFISNASPSGLPQLVVPLFKLEFLPSQAV